MHEAEPVDLVAHAAQAVHLAEEQHIVDKTSEVHLIYLIQVLVQRGVQSMPVCSNSLVQAALQETQLKEQAD
jgi:intracellular sulfur oxidation DsrE/DsrF family protein